MREWQFDSFESGIILFKLELPLLLHSNECLNHIETANCNMQICEIRNFEIGKCSKIAEILQTVYSYQNGAVCAKMFVVAAAAVTVAADQSTVDVLNC